MQVFNEHNLNAIVSPKNEHPKLFNLNEVIIILM